MKDKLVIRYKPLGGQICADGQIDGFVEKIIKDLDGLIASGQEYYIGSELIIFAMRAAICDRRLPHDKIVFLYKDYALRPDHKGRLRRWPEGFCDYSIKYLMRL